MMRPLLLALGLGLAGCSPHIVCWYPVAHLQTAGLPWFAVMGRTWGLWQDVPGPLFQTQAELDAFIEKHHLQLCGAKP